MSAARDDRNFAEIVLTGGPCAGKSSSLAFLSDQFAARGIRTLMVPEVATMFITGGISDLPRLAAEEPEKFLAVEREIMLCQRNLRERFRRLAAAFSPQQVVIVYDRADMDNLAYMPAQMFEEIAIEQELTLTELRDSYDAVIHLRSAAFADGYTTANNAARSETPEQARAMCDAVLAAWQGHPHLWVVNPVDDFQAKRERVFRIAAHSIGIPAPREIERRFLLAAAPAADNELLTSATTVEIEQIYLFTEDGSEARVRSRGQDGQTSFFWTRKRRLDDGSREEEEALITRREYERLLGERDPERRPVRKRRHCFVWEGSYFELDEIERPREEPLWILEAELLDFSDHLELPDQLLEIEREITGEAAYDNSQLALAG